MTDLIQRLRDYADNHAAGIFVPINPTILRMAVSEIERLRLQIKRCGGEACMGYRVDGAAHWVRAERLVEAHREIERLRAERDALRETLPLHEVGSAYAHRLALILECALLDPTGTWNDGHALLDAYRAACQAANPEPPTFMGEPVVNAVLVGEAP